MFKFDYFTKTLVSRDSVSQNAIQTFFSRPYLDKIIVHFSFKENFFKIEKILPYSLFILEFLTNQKACFSISTKDVSSWRLRRTNLVSVHTTLRGVQMFFFFEKFLFFFIPKIKHFTLKQSNNIVFVQISNYMSFIELERESINFAKKSSNFKNFNLSVIFVFKNTDFSKVHSSFFLSHFQNYFRYLFLYN